MVRLCTGLVALVLLVSAAPAGASAPSRFQRFDTMPVFRNSSAAEHTAAEIAAATADGELVVYTDSPGRRIGFAKAGREFTPDGVLPMPGEPTSVDIVGRLALVAVDTSKSYTEPSGVLVVVDLGSRHVVATHELGGQPDSIDISADGRYAAIAVENERDEDVNGGALPQAPAGYLTIVDLVGGGPASWQLREVELTGIAQVAPADPEPEYVSINGRGQVAVTLQENNHIAIVDLRSGRIVRHFSAGTATVARTDTKDDGRFEPTETITAAREPDAVAWLDDRTLGTADEGDYLGGSRTWTVFDAGSGEVVFSSGNDLQRIAVEQGQYPDGRSDNKGVEPEGLAVATFGRDRYAFVGMERANLVAVYDVSDPRRPRFLQALPTGVGPEGLLPIPATGTLVVAAEEDAAGDGIRSSLSGYRLTHKPLALSSQRNQGTPSIVSDGIGFGALSGLSGIPGNHRDVVAVTDSAYSPTRILTVDTVAAPAKVRAELTLTKDGKPVGYDGEGIAARGSGYWIAVEGDGKQKPNLLVEVAANGAVTKEVPLPEVIAKTATGNGFEGVTVIGSGRSEQVWLAVQREWKADRLGQATLARYTPATGEWAFAAYPLDAPQAGAWIGLSEITALNDRTLLVLERDNQRGDAARTKKVYRVDITGVTPVAAGAEKPLVAKKQAEDLLPALQAGGATTHDKPEGLAVIGTWPLQRLVGVVDNDGLDDAPGESVFLRLGWIR
ncbi:esterase-like activity of phytase family protein [Lentzea sp. NEAU-D7]|uniref:esterase-like activity of phytase family protein n=1 Tax=Lentzea sp. NEAU-D7 TaxID=2994667 RepID=UPI00224ADDD5|nr:esterase-like activity of phytase family protein [Lentzea sp. NEAU-D7]MCX2949771.1 esterase-like activity of phytase family protein [Lentzea sp. NEAU-D7]MCX2951101.1 esterase-like activity of phytase family protein [Lentzea sp. NEAU-D7]